MDKELISYDPLNGISTYHSYDPFTDETTLHYVADCEPVLEANKALANSADYTRHGFKNEFWHYASIPPIVQMKWLFEEGIDVWKKEHGDRVSSKLEDPQWRYLKTTNKVHRFK